jgi:DNA-binding protein HU-beta
MNSYHKERQIFKKSQKSTRKVFFKEKKPIYLQAKKLETYCITYKIFIEMTKADIVNEISKRTGVDKVTVLSSVETFMDVVKESLAKEENVYLRGFGSFIVKKRAQKTARNISKNTTIIIPEHNIPSFKPAKTFVSEVKK